MERAMNDPEVPNQVRSRRPAQAAALLMVLAAVVPAGRAEAQTEAPPGVDPAPEVVRAREDTYETPRGIGMGLGSRAGVTGTSAVAYNAANLPLASVYHVESIFGWVPGENAFMTGGAIADSVTNRLAAGMAFRGVFGGGDRDFSGWDGRLSVGTRLAESISLGVSARYLRLRADRDTSDGQPIGEEARGFTVDATARFTPVEGFHIAALAYNLVDLGTALVPRRVGGGVAYQYESVFEVGFDTLVDLSTFETAKVVLGGGVQYVPGNIVPLRLGFQYDGGRRSSSLTAAAGYTQAKFGVDLALRQDFGRDRGTQLLLAVRYHVN
jgi:hypothetical protein